MNITRIMGLCLIFSLASPGSIHAQENKSKKAKIGSFLRKVGEQTTGINMSNEFFIVNPAKSDVDIQLVGCYGNSGTRTATLIFTAKALHQEYPNAVFGGSTKAYDAKGKLYDKCQKAGYNITLPSGIAVPYGIEGIKNVSPELKQFEIIRLSWYLDSENHFIKDNPLEFRNVPIQWDVDPEE